MDNKNTFKPYISDDKSPKELTLVSVLTGIVISVIFGAANAYLGLRVGMTISASIPASVMAMGIIRYVFKRNSILESNIVQTIGSAGESLVAGAIFTLPVLYLWQSEGIIEKVSIFEVTLISLISGILGIMFMIPLRKILIVKQHGKLLYPEGKACSEVLLSGEKESTNSKKVFSGIFTGSILKFITDGLKLFSGEITIAVKGLFTSVGTQVYPAIISVGFISGLKIASYLFAGGVLSYLVIIPLITLFGSDSILFSSTISIKDIYLSGGSDAIWDNYVRYIGAGALSMAGILTLIKTLPMIIKMFGKSFSSFEENENKKLRTQDDLSNKYIIITAVLSIIILWLSPTITIGIFGAIFTIIFAFFFSSVSSQMVGLVGSSNNPVSAMAIATIIVSGFILKLFAIEQINLMKTVITIGSVICISCAIAGDTSQDLKTGYILGATPKKQQIAEIIGVLVSSLSIGATFYLFSTAWGFGSKELPSPQAMLMKMVTEGVTYGNLPWELIFIGAFVSFSAFILKIPPLAFSIGLYLPFSLTSSIMIGALIREMVKKCERNEKIRKKKVRNGVLYSSGLIAGEGIIGVVLSLFSVFNIERYINMSSFIPNIIYNYGGVLCLALIAVLIYKTSKVNDKKTG